MTHYYVIAENQPVISVFAYSNKQARKIAREAWGLTKLPDYTLVERVWLDYANFWIDLTNQIFEGEAPEYHPLLRTSSQNTGFF